MCAIFGILGEYNENQAKSALALLSHRGPDYCGIVQKEKSLFAHQRLSILDTHHRSHQPLKHKNILLSFNGEIYNFQDLKRELDFDFSTESDSEVIMAAYLKWGVDFVQHLRGMFAIALLDGDTLYLFRDRLGKKPLFYMEGSSFIFASEIKALKPLLPTCKLNNDALLSYLSFLAPTPPHTFYEGIKKLSAGEYLTCKEGRVTCKRYFDLLDVTPNIITNKHKAIRLLEEELQNSIRMRLSADVPMASLLSGGIDSATLNYFAKQNNTHLQTYTLGYKEFAKYDERKNAKASAEFLGLDNIQIEINEDDFIQASDKVLDTLDEPLNDPAAVPLYLLFQRIQQDGYKVVLSGEGADELFLGYRQYFEYLDIEKAAGLAHKNWLKKYFRANFSMNREWEWYKRIFDETLLFRTSGEKVYGFAKNQLLRRNVKDNESLKYLQSYRERFESSQHKDESIWYSYIDLNLFQAEHFLTKLDRVSMAHSIESRTPFLDHKLASLIFSIDPKLRYEDGITKSLLKQIMTNKLPNEILTRKKKGFSNPYMEYLIHSKKIDLIQEVNAQTGMFHKKKLDEYINTASKGSFKQHVWGLYVLSYWIKGICYDKKNKKYATTNTLVIFGIVLGVLFGIFFPELALKQKMIGTAFVYFLKMLVVPLVFASIFVAILGLGSIEHLKRMGLKTIGLYVLTTALAVVAAIVAMNIFHIGEHVSSSGLAYAKATTLTPFSFENMLLSFIPTNIFHALSEGKMMQIIVFAILFGVASLTLLPKQQEVLNSFFTAVSEAMLKMAEWVILLTPIGVFSLISYVIAEQGIDVVFGLYKYVLLVVGVILFHAIITLPTVLRFFTKINPYSYLSDVREAPIMAFSTASSAATLPVSMRVVEEIGGVDKKTASFVLPLGATVSMDGTAAYLSVAVLYIANLAGVDLSLGDQILLGVTVVALSVGVAALPSASLVMMVVILNQLGLPVKYMALIVAVDRILDMCRTSLNVTSDLIVTKIVDEFEKRR